MTTATEHPAPVMTRSRTLVFAVASALAVGNLYLAQPLIETIARSLHVHAASAGILITIAQIGYALGIFLIVPLEDVLDRCRLRRSGPVGRVWPVR